MFFYLSKIGWLLVAPDTLILLLLIAAAILLKLGRVRLAGWALGINLTFVAALTLLPMGDWLLSPLESRFPVNPELPGEVDGIVVLGGAASAQLSAMWDQPEVTEAAERYLAFISLGREFPDARLVFAGGTGSLRHPGFGEARVAQQLLDDQGFEVGRVQFETESRNTHENAIRSKQITSPGPGENWILITTSWHMPRAVGVFCQANWPVVPWPVDHYTLPEELLRLEFDLTENLRRFKMAQKEWIGLAAYYLTGRSSALFPDGCGATAS